MDDLCRACFDGVYPVDLPEPELLGKQLLEPSAALGGRRRRAQRTVGGGGAAEALNRP